LSSFTLRLRAVPLSNAFLDEVDEEPSSNPLVPTRRDNSDRYLGDILGDVAVTMVDLGVGPAPRRAERSVVVGDQSVVTWPWPSREVQRVARIGEYLLRGRCLLVGAPNRGLAEHRGEKGAVLNFGWAASNVLHAGWSNQLSG